MIPSIGDGGRRSLGAGVASTRLHHRRNPLLVAHTLQTLSMPVAACSAYRQQKLEANRNFDATADQRRDGKPLLASLRRARRPS
jgi:hypothetical protein